LGDTTVIHSKGPLEGVKVIEMGTWIAVPGAAAILGDWGADVIKVENLEGGDPLRGIRRVENIEIKDMHFGWELVNRNKKSIAMDTRTEQGKEILYKLTKTVDIFMTNRVPRGTGQQGLDYTSLSRLKPRLIYVLFTGFGEIGPDREKAGYDITAFWARGGFMYKTGEPGRIPPTQPLSVGDQISAMYIAGAISTALFARERTGKGQKISLSLYQNAAWTIAWELQAFLYANEEIRWRYQDEAVNPLWNLYQTADKRWIQLACLQSDRHWYPFCEAIGREDLKQDSRFASDLKRGENSRSLVSLIKDIISNKTLEEWEKILRRHRIIYERCNSISEVVNDPQALENDFIVGIRHPSGHQLRLVNSPVKFSGTPSSIKSSAPEYGQNTEEILLELGYAWDNIAKFKEEGVIL
jgi:crotonobetainyl-CoA:carnitine CoA-transferase CaiB-like acyl-CoA transferase